MGQEVAKDRIWSDLVNATPILPDLGLDLDARGLQDRDYSDLYEPDSKRRVLG